MLDSSSLDFLRGKKNLLAFSAGGDSTALFFLLAQNKIKFDIAIVNYGIREQSTEEIKYAKELSEIHNCLCHTLDAPKFNKNFEANARKIRYDFFEELISLHDYENLITAHHIGDRLEWMLMQFCKGAGCAEMVGMTKEEKRDSYTLVRPLLHLDKKELLNFLNAKKIKYFEDESNFDEDIKRNLFRHNYSAPLLEKYLNGIKKSFEYLDEDKQELIKEIDIKTIDDFAYFKSSLNKRADIYAIDKYLKSKLYMPSAKERELLKTEKTVVLGRNFIVNQDRDFVFILPSQREPELKMPKKFKEECRIFKIEPKLRSYLFRNEKAFLKIREILL